MLSTGFFLLAIMVMIAISVKGQLLARRPIISAPRGGTAVGGKPRRGMAYRSYEGDIAAVDTLTNLTAFGGSAQTVIVPQGASELDIVDIGVSFDLGAAVVSVRGHAQVRIIGQGIEGSPHDFGGPAGTFQGVTSGNLGAFEHVRYSNLNIPVVGGGELQVQGALIGEDPGDATFCVTLGYVLA
jgi:hypothetical protein